jgi:hypothetical protein
MSAKSPEELEILGVDSLEWRSLSWLGPGHVLLVPRSTGSKTSADDPFSSAEGVSGAAYSGWTVYRRPSSSIGAAACRSET